MDDNLLDWMELPQSGNIGKHVSFHVVLVQILLRSSIDPPVDCTTQWGEWLRESPGRSASKTKTGQKPAVSNNLSHGRSKSSYGEFGHMRHTTVCDLPTRHNLCREYTPSGVSRIGEEHRADGVVVNVGDMP